MSLAPRKKVRSQSRDGNMNGLRRDRGPSSDQEVLDELRLKSWPLLGRELIGAPSTAPRHQIELPYSQPRDLQPVNLLETLFGPSYCTTPCPGPEEGCQEDC